MEMNPTINAHHPSVVGARLRSVIRLSFLPGIVFSALLLPPPVPTPWIGAGTTQAQENDAAYEEEVLKGKQLLRQRKFEEALKYNRSSVFPRPEALPRTFTSILLRAIMASCPRVRTILLCPHPCLMSTSRLAKSSKSPGWRIRAKKARNWSGKSPISSPLAATPSPSTRWARRSDKRRRENWSSPRSNATTPWSSVT